MNDAELWAGDRRRTGAPGRHPELRRFEESAGYAFDAGRGDLFVCRVAGNFANDESIASLEYAVADLAVPLVLVMGHDKCGAVEATIASLRDDTTLPGHPPSLVAALKSATPILEAAVGGGRLKVVGGIYGLADGRAEIVAQSGAAARAALSAFRLPAARTGFIAAFS